MTDDTDTESSTGAEPYGPKLRRVDPYTVNVDEMNERTENLNLGELEKSIAEQGVIQPPLVRERNGQHEVPYTVVVGQRRVMAAQGVGLDEIPVVVVNWDDAEALEKSISENIDTFRQDVSKKDRAKAVRRLKELNGWDNSDVAESLGVSPRTIRNWLEWVRPEWEGTSIHADNGSETEKSETVSEELDPQHEPAEATVRTARELTGGGEEGEQLLGTIEESGLRKDQVNEVRTRVKKRHGDDVEPSQIEDVVAEVEAEEAADAENRIYIDFTATNNLADAIEDAGEDRGLSNREVVRSATAQWLKREGYL